jgi:nicotinate-nucleotide adenylyltransferase
VSAAATIALFGTSADPPSTGHLALLAGLLDHYPQVVTWASTNPFKQHGAPLELRAALLQALVDQLANPRLSLEQQLSSPRAIETLARAQARWPGAELVFVVGSDLVSQIPRWVQAQQLLGQCRLAVVPRQGWPLEEAELERLRQLGARIGVLPLAIPASASSLIRHHPSPELVPPALWPHLVKHNLYGAGHQGAGCEAPNDSRGAGTPLVEVESATQSAPQAPQPWSSPLARGSVTRHETSSQGPTIGPLDSPWEGRSAPEAPAPAQTEPASRSQSQTPPRPLGPGPVPAPTQAPFEVPLQPSLPSQPRP